MRLLQHSWLVRRGRPAPAAGGKRRESRNPIRPEWRTGHGGRRMPSGADGRPVGFFLLGPGLDVGVGRIVQRRGGPSCRRLAGARGRGLLAIREDRQVTASAVCRSHGGPLRRMPLSSAAGAKILCPSWPTLSRFWREGGSDPGYPRSVPSRRRISHSIHR
jgi:hypothetical protein